MGCGGGAGGWGGWMGWIYLAESNGEFRCVSAGLSGTRSGSEGLEQRFQWRFEGSQWSLFVKTSGSSAGERGWLQGSVGLCAQILGTKQTLGSDSSFGLSLTHPLSHPIPSLSQSCQRWQPACQRGRGTLKEGLL